MGSGNSSSGTQRTYKFRNGKPTMAGNMVTPMFNNMFYRISDTESSKWGFYNDSVDLHVHIAILFDYDSTIVPLGDTTAFRIDDPEDGNEDDYGKYLCEVDVGPGETKEFIQGKITGWKVDTLEARTSSNERTYRL
ncbi:hypothetical protein STCU_00385 [Strigomonas culicis]|uniref:DUF1935 domain-containing protein n=1 Tax=Strigomonas culicis TaxID=28005 RepID=S9WBH6_9TRYP|nr:hypothetical protein STCU_02258 [Strigomonas culicis]EPY35904.1 hypothetical protein STCU_00853 [Strigomonas culicis]EPY36831.1 hypothetical protein STCU_00385 [Strigomonas culicis]|eukprot:EPY33370.1 hypothetical protein STCU_02258 [Strigomonas culicis]